MKRLALSAASAALILASAISIGTASAQAAGKQEMKLICPSGQTTHYVYDYVRGAGDSPIFALDPQIVGMNCDKSPAMHTVRGLQGAKFESLDAVKSAFAYIDNHLSRKVASK